MAEYIERESVVRELNKIYDNMNAMGAQFYGGFMNAVYRIKDFPAADVAPVWHGRWIKHPTFNYKICSVCSGGTPCDIDGSEWLSRHCQSCGAKMDG